MKEIAEIHYSDGEVTLLTGGAREVMDTLPVGSVDCIVTSPPYYGLRDYGATAQLGNEKTAHHYVNNLVVTFRAARVVLAPHGTLWLNLGDSYDPHTKALRGMPWHVALALAQDGWLLRNEVIWHKPNACPESATDRLTRRHEHLFLFTKGPDYWFDLDPIRERYTGDRAPSRRAHHGGNKPHTAAGSWTPSEKGRNPGSVWSISTTPYKRDHIAPFPVTLPMRCISAGCKPGGTVLDPFSGSGTTGQAATFLGRKYIGIDINPAYHKLAMERMAQPAFDWDPQ